MMEPLVSICLDPPNRIYRPGQKLSCQYQIDAVAPNEIVAIEASVLWRTEGKGDEDMGVHHFERRVPADAWEGEMRQLFCFDSRLPNCPLSYDGTILKIKWAVRVRAFFKKGREAMAEQPFILSVDGKAPPRRTKPIKGMERAAPIEP